MEHYVPEILTSVQEILTTGEGLPERSSAEELDVRERPSEQRLWAALVEEANNFAAHCRISRLLEAMRQYPSENQVVGGRTVEEWVRILAARLDECDPLRQGPAALIKRIFDERA